MGNITITKKFKCDQWCKLSIWFNAPWKGGLLDFIASISGHG